MHYIYKYQHFSLWQKKLFARQQLVIFFLSRGIETGLFFLVTYPLLTPRQQCDLCSNSKSMHKYKGKKVASKHEIYDERHSKWRKIKARPSILEQRNSQFSNQFSDWSGVLFESEASSHKTA